MTHLLLNILQTINVNIQRATLPIEIVSRQIAGKQAWDAFVDSHPVGTFWARSTWLDYCLAYRQGIDCSIAARHRDDGKILAIFPLMIEGREFACGGNPLTPGMLATQNQSHAQLLSALAASMAETIALTCGVASGDMMMPFRPACDDHATDNEPHEDDRHLTKDFTTRIVDLSISEDVRWKDVRKSYKQLIRQGGMHLRKEWFSSSYECMQIYRDLHRARYGHVRTEDTYRLQSCLADEGIARPFIYVDDADQHVAAVLWYIYKDVAYYASGVFMEENLAHYAVWDSMNELGKSRILYAELGWSGRAIDEKGQNVEFFKRGFGGYDVPVRCIMRVFSTHQTGGAA
jgi:hypothetical protein